MARIYANENFPLPVVERLIQMGHDVLTTQMAGNAGRSVSDVEVFDFAVREQRVLLTLNRRHFLRLADQNPIHPGLIACTFDADYDRQARNIDAAIQKCASLDNQVLRINRPSR